MKYLEGSSPLNKTLNSVSLNTSNPLIVRDLNRCVSCGRCVRVCREVRGVNALEYGVAEDVTTTLYKEE